MACKFTLRCLLGISIYMVSEIIANEALVGGKLAKTNEFPYHVSIQDPHKGHICGGGIIDDQFILTAAHCVVRTDNHIDPKCRIVVSGTGDLRHIQSPAVISSIETIYLPIEFNPQNPSTTGDIAILKLKESLSVWKRRNLKKLKLPSKQDKSYIDKTAVIAGFGQPIANVELDDIKMSNHLLFSEAEIITNHQCQKVYDVEKISEEHICARVQQYDDKAIRGTCLGDSGSPLVVKGTTVVGILSRGPNDCNERVMAAVYTRVSSYLDFISRVMSDKIDYKIRAHEIH